MKHLSILMCLLMHTNSSRILIINSIPDTTASSTMLRIAEELVNRNHQVTGINVIPRSFSHPNYTTINVPNLEFLEERKEALSKESKRSNIGKAGNILEYGLITLEGVFANNQVQNLLNKSKNFDVVIVNYYFNYAVFAIAHHLQAPLILLNPFLSKTPVNDLVANPTPSSNVPLITSSRTSSMNFWERFQNLWENMYVDLLKHFVYLPKHRNIVEKHIKSNLKLDDIIYNVSLVLLNSHCSIAGSSPLLPNMIEIGGFHLKPSKQLPKDLQDFLDDAKEGVIIFSLGSFLKPNHIMDERKLGEIINAFSKIKQKVLWKFATNLSLPSNVKAVGGFPQKDVLAHKNVKALITHGGAFSVIEAVYYAVPLIGIPVFGEQGSNIATAESHGYALKISLNNLTEESLLWSINEIIENPRYRNAAKFRSIIFRDRPLKPANEAVYWIEYVIRHKGASHLRSPGLDLVWYKKEMIDIYLLFFMILAAFCLAIFYALKLVFLKKLQSKRQKLE